MNTWAAPGVQCVCINDSWDWWAEFDGYSVPTRVPMLNEVLTIREVVGNDGLSSGVGLVFWEIDKFQHDGPLGATIYFSVHCFWPLEKRKTDISIFRKLLTPAGRIPVDA